MKITVILKIKLKDTGSIQKGCIIIICNLFVVSKSEILKKHEININALLERSLYSNLKQIFKFFLRDWLALFFLNYPRK